MKKVIEHFNHLFQMIAEHQNIYSDIHICTDNRYMIRCNGVLENYDLAISPSKEDIIDFCHYYFPQVNLETLNKTGSIDAEFSFNNDMLRGRANIFKDRAGISVVIRILKNKIPTEKELRIPLSLQKTKNLSHGLVVISGATGSGKSTTLASIIEGINQTQSKRIITIEDPIEYLHHWDKSVISQREVGKDTPTFYEGLRSALRQDPDIIMVGEMRDQDTVATALRAAQTGHLVFSTLHTATTLEAINRIIEFFPSSAHDQIRSEIAYSFKAFVAQQLILTKQNKRYAAFEVLLNTEAVANLIRKGEIYQIPLYMDGNLGMIKMEDSIQGLRNIGLID